MNVWLLHPYAGGPGLGRHWRPFWLADAWARLGHRPVVVTAKFHHVLTSGAQTPGPQQIGGVDFWFLETPSYRGNGFGRLWNQISFGRRFRHDSVDIAERFGRPDVVIASTPHLFFVPAARQVARRFDAKFWIEIRDLWPESIVAAGLAPAWHPLVKVIGLQERYAYRAADRVVSLLPGAEAYMNSRGLAPGTFVWVPNGVSDGEMRSALEPQNIDHRAIERMKTMKAQGKRVVLYAGAMGPPNALENVIDAAAILSKTNPEICFLLIGAGVSRSQLEQRAANLPNVEFQDEVDRPIIHAMLRDADCAVMCLHENAHYDHGISPNKLFDYFLFGPRTVIACGAKALAGHEDLVTLRCEADNPALLAEALKSALRIPERPLDQRAAVIKRFGYSELAARYLA